MVQGENFMVSLITVNKKLDYLLSLGYDGPLQYTMGRENGNPDQVMSIIHDIDGEQLNLSCFFLTLLF